MKDYFFSAAQFLPKEPGEVFRFFSNAQNLEALTPPWIKFKIITPMPIEISEVELEPLLQDAWESLKLHAQKHDAQLDFQWNAEPGLVETDPRRFKQIIKNLAGNACKFRDSDGQRPNRVLVNVRQQGEGLDIEISDTGRGMKLVEQEKLFVKFQKLSAREGNSSGTGLGLVITKSLVELMGGQVTFESEFGVGSTFRVHLPASYDHSEIQAVDARTSGTQRISTTPADSVQELLPAIEQMPAASASSNIYPERRVSLPIRICFRTPSASRKTWAIARPRASAISGVIG